MEDNTEGKVIPWSKIKVVHATWKHPGKLFYKTQFDSEYQVLYIFQKPKSKSKDPEKSELMIKHAEVLKSLDLKKLYDLKLGISAAKHKDLQSLCKNLDIP